MLLFLLACAPDAPKCEATQARDRDGDGYAVDECGDVPVGDPDCDDDDPNVYPDAPETCDGRDEDCDGEVDEEADVEELPLWYRDGDFDGYGDLETGAVGCDAPEGFVADGTDCDDADAAVSPAADEVCGGGDEDCDGEVDEDDAADAASWYRDRDGDGYGGTSALTDCEQPEGYVATGGDCDDSRDFVHPGADEQPGDTLDDDCDGTIGCYADTDGDGWGGDGVVASADADCRDAGEGTSARDCDDTRADTYPDAPETPYDGVDQDCDGADLVDVDGDGWDATAVGGEDCDDDDAAVNPDGTEVCDFYDTDDDCDGLADEADPDLGGTAETWYADADGDGAGDAATAATTICPPNGYVRDASDCDDTDASIRPLATETCDDTVDRNCDGYVGTDDHDGDGYAACEDCDDGDASESPAAAEALDGDDDDCDGLVDEYAGDLVVASEADATTFCATYGSVEGDLDVDGLASLDALECLRAVSGDLRLSGVTGTDLWGLRNLTDVGGDLLVGGWQEETGMMAASAFRSLDGLERLARVGGDLWVADNDVADLSGMGRLASVGGGITLLDLPVAAVDLPVTTIGDGLWLEQLPYLTSVSAPALTSFGGSLWLDWLATASGGFTLDWSVDIPGTLGIVALPAGANAGWVLPDTVGGLDVEDNDLADLAGLDTLRQVDGDVLVEDNPLLTDLSALDGIEEITGDLAVKSNARLPGWDDFAGLTRVGGWVRLTGNGPTSASGFGALEEIGEGLDVESSAYLVSIDGFGRLASCPVLTLSALSNLADAPGLAGAPFSSEVTVESVGDVVDLSFLSGVTTLDGSLVVTGNSSLTSLAGLEGLTSLGGALTVQDDRLLADAAAPALASVGGALSLVDLPALTRLDLTALQTVGGDAALDTLTTLPDLGGLSSLREVDGLLVSNCDTIPDLSGLDALTTADGSVIVEVNDALTTLAGLGALRTVGEDLRFTRNAALVDLAGLDSLESVGRDLTLDTNAALVRPDGLAALTAIGRDLWVEYDTALVDLAGMGTFTVGNTVYFAGDGALRSLDGLDGLAEIPHHLVLYDLPALTDLGALSGVTRIGADLRISACDSLVDLRGLDSLGEVGESVEIGYQASWGYGSGNVALETLDGLGALRTVGDDLYIEQNDVLFDIDALDGLESVGRNLGVTNNPSLPTADAEDLADGSPTVGGSVSIYGNL